MPLTEQAVVERVPLHPSDDVPKGARAILLLTEEDLSPESWPLSDVDVRGVAIFASDGDGPNGSPAVRAFKAGALTDARNRVTVKWCKPVISVASAGELLAFAANQGAVISVTSKVPVGFVRPEIDAWTKSCATAGIPLLNVTRRWDSLFWPHATAGFFKLKERIPGILAKLELAPPERPL